MKGLCSSTGIQGLYSAKNRQTLCSAGVKKNYLILWRAMDYVMHRQQELCSTTDKQKECISWDRQELFIAKDRQGIYIARIDKYYVVLRRAKAYLMLRTNEDYLVLGYIIIM